MPYKRMRTQDERPFKRAKYPKKERPPSFRKMFSNPVMRVQKTWRSQNWSPTTTTTGDFWKYLIVNLGDMPFNAEYSAIFDSYKIHSVKYSFRPRYDSFAGNDTTDTTLPGVTNQGGDYMHVIIDPKSQVGPTGTYTGLNLNTFLENGKVKTYQGSKPFEFTINYPMVLDDVNNSGNAEVSMARWFSTGSTSIGHRGAHVFAQDVNLTGVFGNSYDIFITLDISFKGIK